MGLVIPGHHTVPDARRQGGMTEAYHSYAAGRNGRRRYRMMARVEQGNRIYIFCGEVNRDIEIISDLKQL